MDGSGGHWPSRNSTALLFKNMQTLAPGSTAQHGGGVGGADSSSSSQLSLHQMPKVLSPSAGGDRRDGNGGFYFARMSVPLLGKGCFYCKR